MKQIIIGSETVKLSSSKHLNEVVVTALLAGSTVKVGVGKNNSEKVDPKTARWLILYGYAKEVKE